MDGAKPQDFSCDVDQNSGMTTWLMQQFHKHVLFLAGSSNCSVRLTSFDVVELAIHQGLLSPTVYIEALIAICGDPQGDHLRSRAVRLLHSIGDRHEDVIPPKACGGVIRCFDIVSLSEQHPVTSAFQEATDVAPDTSFHDALYKSLSKLKKNRESFLVGLMRYFYQDSKLEDWCAQRIAALNDHRYNAAVFGGAARLEPIGMLCHLTLQIAFLSMIHIHEAIYILDQTRVALIYVAKYALIIWRRYRQKSQPLRTMLPRLLKRQSQLGLSCLRVSKRILRRSLASQRLRPDKQAPRPCYPHGNPAARHPSISSQR